MSKNYILMLIFGGILALGSCVSPKKVVYMQDASDQAILNTKPATIVLKPDDLLYINVSALNAEVVKPFNPSSGNTGGQTNDANTFLIDPNGFIQFPVLGSIQLAGLTRDQAQKLIQTKLAMYIKDASVTIRIKNLKFSVLGDVVKPGVYTLSGERITLLEALGMAGDMNITGDRNSVMVIREVDGKSQTHTVDLTQSNFMESPVYYLAQNDVVYIRPSAAQVDNRSRAFRYVPIALSATSLIITVISILTR